MKARENSRAGDALFAEEAKALSLDIQSSLHDQKKKRVHAAAAEAVSAVEAKLLAKAARKAHKAMLKTLTGPQKLTPRVRDRFGKFI